MKVLANPVDNLQHSVSSRAEWDQSTHLSGPWEGDNVTESDGSIARVW